MSGWIIAQSFRRCVAKNNVNVLLTNPRSAAKETSFCPLATTRIHESLNRTLQGEIIHRAFGSGARGSRGLGWLTNYRAGKGGRHLQGRWHIEQQEETIEYKAKWNDAIFALNNNQAVMESAYSKVGREIPTHVFMDFGMSEWDEPRRIVIELAVAALPRTCSNFVYLCDSNDGPDGKVPGYSNTVVNMIEKKVALCCGDVLNMDGKGGKCHPTVSELTNGYTFVDEAFLLSHSSGIPGIVSMATVGVDKNDSRFIITLTGMEHHLDGKFVAFGRVVEGFDTVINELGSVFTKKGRPANEIKIVRCGSILSKTISNEDKDPLTANLSSASSTQ